MGILRVDHPDILEFIECKLDGGSPTSTLRRRHRQVHGALAAGTEYDLVNPHTGAVTGRLSAKEVFERIVRARLAHGPIAGMIFIDRINASPAKPTPEIGMVEAPTLHHG